MIRRLLTRCYIHVKLSEELKAGRIDRGDFRRLKRAATAEVCEHAVQSTYAKAGFAEDYPRLWALWQWIVENWDEILKIILTVAPLLLDERDR